VIVALVNLFKHHFPNQDTALNSFELQRTKKWPDCEYLKPFNDIMVFYQFMSMCQVRSHKTFTWWALVNVCLWYGSSVNSAVSGLDAVFFGHSLVAVSMMCKTKSHWTINKDYYDRIRHTLWDLSILLSIVDNKEVSFSLCIQRKGKFNHFIKMTAKTFVEMQFFWEGYNLMLGLRLGELLDVVEFLLLLKSANDHKDITLESVLVNPSPKFRILTYYHPSGIGIENKLRDMTSLQDRLNLLLKIRHQYSGVGHLKEYMSMAHLFRTGPENIIFLIERNSRHFFYTRSMIASIHIAVMNKIGTLVWALLFPTLNFQNSFFSHFWNYF
jgi:hypothetical protein